MQSSDRSPVALTRCDGYDRPEVRRALDDLLAPLGGMRAFVHPGERIALKPNCLLGTAPERAITTHPAVVRAVAQAVSEAGAHPVLVESPGPATMNTERALRRVFAKTGLLAMAEEIGLEVSLDTESEAVSAPDSVLVKRVEVLRALRRADGVISLSKLKTHTYMTFTGAVKNLFGAIPGYGKAGFHAGLSDPDRFADMLLDLADVVAPRLSIMDGVVGLEGDGPGTGGRPRELGVLFAGEDPVAVDQAACRLVGIDAAAVPVLRAAARRGRAALDSLPPILGESLEDLSGHGLRVAHDGRAGRRSGPPPDARAAGQTHPGCRHPATRPAGSRPLHRLPDVRAGLSCGRHPHGGRPGGGGRLAVHPLLLLPRALPGAGRRPRRHAGGASGPRHRTSLVADDGAALPIRLVALDLDGVVYRGAEVLPGVPQTIASLLEQGLLVRYVTNNATLRRADVAEKLRAMGVAAGREQILTSGAAAAAWLRGRLPAGAPLLVVGEAGLLAELEDAGFRPRHAEEGPVEGCLAVVVGLDRGFTYRAMAHAQAALASGVPFVATNGDTTFPAEHALLPGAGALVQAIAAAAGREPDVVIGKPSLELARALETDTGVPPTQTLFVGDRLDTDIEMAHAAGMRAVLVLTGVSRREDLASATVSPDAVLETLPELLRFLDHPW